MLVEISFPHDSAVSLGAHRKRMCNTPDPAPTGGVERPKSAAGIALPHPDTPGPAGGEPRRAADGCGKCGEQDVPDGEQARQADGPTARRSGSALVWADAYTMPPMPFYHRPGRALRPLPALSPAPAATPAAAPPAASAADVGYAVIDLETTGLSPATDSIIEIGLVLLGPDGSAQRSWTTLVDPGASVDVGPTYIHGLVAEDLIGAPALAEIADLLVRDLAGRAVVAHNARFDVGFLTQALGGLGRLGRGARIPRVCTMELARSYITTPSRRLVTCCESAGVRIGSHHCALDDARACAGLLRHYMSVGSRRGDDLVAWSRSLESAAAFSAWTWDGAAARTQEDRLVPRADDGVPRLPRELRRPTG